ncbi:hypothetical protein K144313037_p20080 (plasmid) [Clostridium tetani]|nr:hypothetical protein [Clostridium tetani]BDR66734.1 hypothetical protein K144312032_09620 [Clostridium tetani]BDR71221.1 hypothetical protein K144313037_p20080 [Clostridium tetani]BDR72225.1 hypothetical protein K144316041_09330 [Clostridium tetani]BEV19102.1 hypothetical protein K154301001_09570 [Clostridium tetani]
MVIAMNYRVEIIDKGEKKTTLKRIVLNIVIDRRIDMQTASATVVVQDVKSKVPSLYNFGYTDGIIANGNHIRIYISDKIQFTGIIRNFEIDDEAKTININCHDVGCKILRPIDGGVPYHAFNNINATQLISNMAIKAGLGTPIFNIISSNNYAIKNLKMQYDVQMSDIIDEVLKTLEARARVLKDGTYKVEKLYPDYKASDVQNKINYDFYYEDFIIIGKANRKRGSETLYNRVLVRHANDKYNVFEDPSMVAYLGYKNFKEIESPLGDTVDKRQKVASRFFLDCWRENSNVDIVATKGNPDLDLGKIVRIKLNEMIGHYIVTGIRTELTPDGNYIDQISLDGMREVNNIAKLGKGNYTLKEGDK